MDKIEDYYNLINDSTYIQNLNSGTIVTDKQLSGLAFNTGPLYNKRQNKDFSSPSEFYAENTKVQSNVFNIKNIK